MPVPRRCVPGAGLQRRTDCRRELCLGGCPRCPWSPQGSTGGIDMGPSVCVVRQEF